MQSYEPEQISEMFTPLSTYHSYQTRSVVNGNLYMPTTRLFTEQRSLSYAGSKLRNEISFEIRNADSLNSFDQFQSQHNDMSKVFFCGLSSWFQSIHNNNI